MNSKKNSTIILSHSGENTIPESSQKKEQNNAKSSSYNSFNLFSLKGYDMPQTLEEQLKKKEIRKSSEQKTPYNVNRNILLFVYFALIVLTNRLFFGWPNLSNLLFREDTYIWKCKKNSDGTYDRVPDKRYVCDDQDKAVQTIFVFGSSAYFAFSFFNGLIVDYLGSRFSMLLGHILNLIGWILILVSNENFDAYVIGGIFTSASIDLASFSTLNASGLYPGNENLIVNIISGAGSLSTGTMTILDLIISGLNLSFKTFMLWYMCISVGFFFIITIFLFPRTRYFRQYEFDNYYKNKEINLVEKEEMDTMKKVDENNYVLQNVEIQEDIEMDNMTSRKSDYNEMGINENRKVEDYASTNNSSITSKKKQNIFKSTTFKDLFNIFTCAHFLCLWIYGPLNAIYNTFYYSVVENILSKDKNDILGYILPFSFIPCVILGNITDKFGIMIMFAYELLFAMSMYAFSYSKSSIAQWISVISNTLYSACANGQLWTFISYTFSSKYHSTLIGFLNFVCGIVSFVRLLLFEWAKYTNYDFTYINLLIICMIGVNIALAIALVFIRKIKGEKVIYGDENPSK
ncbi:transporter, putative [Plasmodium gallinaceum]|uniref:Transporter, putative n=1 Tax=Plasmodium gallinaceum TaxID=5849 RepID=A0A1J1GVR6_PLAGA|nr:transporter, putative [Plasmodium gallinaceum]CRG96350.1 transporter, putative [Plasmodium gallinaceum]